jgi:hypothetical protein
VTANLPIRSQVCSFNEELRLDVDLQAAINRFLDEHNAKPKPFTLTTDPDDIIGRQTFDAKQL